MKSKARAAAGKAAWAAKSPAEKAAIRARLARGRANAARSNGQRGNLTNYETKVIGAMVRTKKRKSSSKKRSSPAKAATPKAASTRKVASSRKAASSRPRQPSPAQIAARQRFADMARARAAAARTGRMSPTDIALIEAQGRPNLTPAERAKLQKLLNGSHRRRRRSANKAFRTRNAKRVASGQPPLARRRRKASSKRKSSSKRRSSARPNMYIARPNMYIETRANPKKRRSRKRGRRNLYIRRNPGVEKLKTGLILAGLGIGSFMVTNVAQHFVGRLSFAQGAIADYGVPAALAALVWLGPTGKMLRGNRHVGKNGQIALTAGIVGAVVNKMLDNMITDGIRDYIPVVGEPLSKLLTGEYITGLGGGASGVGEYVYDLPDSGMGEYVRDPRMLSVEREMQGLAYVDLQQRAANEEALRAANIKATQPSTDSTSQFDDQFEPGF